MRLPRQRARDRRRTRRRLPRVHCQRRGPGCQGAPALPDGSLSPALAVPDSVAGNGTVHRVADLVIEGAGGEGLREPEDVLDAANSGTTARLLSGILAGRPFFRSSPATPRCGAGPMDRVIEPLTAMGARIVGRDDNRCLPMALSPAQLRAIEYELPVASAQLKSCLLLAGLQATGTTVLHEPAASRDHTERMLRSQGASLRIEGRHLTLTGGAALEAVDVAVPGDLSSAAFWLVAALLHPQASVTVERVGINPGRTGLLDVLTEMGGRITAYQPAAGGRRAGSGHHRRIELSAWRVCRRRADPPAPRRSAHPGAGGRAGGRNDHRP